MSDKIIENNQVTIMGEVAMSNSLDNNTITAKLNSVGIEVEGCGH